MRGLWFWIALVAIFVIGNLVALNLENSFVFHAGYTVLQFVVLATAWNILGGFTGYVNFGSAAFFAIGAYTSIAMQKWLDLPLPLLIVAGGVVAGLIGLGVGLLTLRLRGVFFAIATLALAVVLETVVANWEYVGGARGAIVIPPDSMLFFDEFIRGLFVVMLLLALIAVGVAKVINDSRFGRGLAAIRDDEVAAEATGVPTLKLKLISTTVSGALMGIAGAPYPLYVTFVEPASAFHLSFAVNAIAMPMIGGTATWLGPVVGALLLGTIQEWAKVTQLFQAFGQEVNLLLVGVMLVGFVILAPQGIVGLVRRFFGKRKA